MDNTLSVSQLNVFIRDVLNSGFPQPVWVCGEIQGYDRGKDKKHVFFELCEKDPVTHEIKARIGLVIFANTRPSIEATLAKAENAFRLKDDIEVKFLCSVDFYPGHGQVRLIVAAIDPIYTLGKIAQDRQRLIAQLKQQGLLDKNKQTSMPRVPLNIGLITSYDSAAYHDFIDEIKRSGFGFSVHVINTLMQGKNAEASVKNALERLQGNQELDVIVITRGGGSIAELSCFDSALIAQTIALCPLPVISGIGHEINTTVTDLAAHTFAKTPTAVAQFLIGRVQEFLDHLQEKEKTLIGLAEDVIAKQKEHLKGCAVILQTGTVDLFKQQHQRLSQIGQILRQMPVNALKISRQRLDQTQLDLNKTIHLRLTNSRTKIQAYQKLIEMADPHNILKRGFSITRRADGKIIRTKKDAKSGDVLNTQVSDGIIKSKV